MTAVPTTSALTPTNYYATTLASNIGTTDTTIYLNGALPTGTQGFLEIGEGLSTKEIIFYTALGSNFVTLPSAAAGRGIGGTSAAAHTSGETVKQKLNAEWWLALQNGNSIANNAIQAASLATSAITLGYAQITSPFTTTTTTAFVDVTGLAITVTVPAGGRGIKITLAFSQFDTTAAGGTVLTAAIREGSTALGQTNFNQASASTGTGLVWVAYVPAPSAGSHTYKASIAQSAAGTLNVGSGLMATYNSYGTSFILVEAI